MYALVGISIFILIVAYIIYSEYKNEKVYQEERKRRSNERKHNKAPYNPKEKIQKPHLNKKEKAVKRKQHTPGAKEKTTPEQIKKEKDLSQSYALKESESEDTRQVTQQPIPEKKVIPEVITEEIPEVIKEVITEKPVEKTYDLPACKYPAFDYSRLIGMGLAEDEAIEFTKELIPQIKTQIPLIKEALIKEDFHLMEKLTHSIKGSSTTVGTGGVSDLLVEFNTYLKTGKEIPIAEAYFDHLTRYAEELEKQFA